MVYEKLTTNRLDADLYNAVCCGNREKVHDLLAGGADPYANCGRAMRASLGHPDIFAYFVSQKDVFNDHELPAANHVLTDGVWQYVFPLLLPKLAHPNVTDWHGCTLLFSAVVGELGAAVEVLEAFGAKLSMTEQLHAAVALNRISDVRDCIERGADVNAVYRDTTPLYASLWSGEQSLWRTLLSAKADPNGVSPILWRNLMCLGLKSVNTFANVRSQGDVALRFAAVYGMCDAIRDLLEFGASPNYVNYNNMTPFMDAVISAQPAAATLLHKVQPSFSTVNWKLLYGCLVGDVHIVRDAIASGADAKFRGDVKQAQMGSLGLSVCAQAFDLVQYLCRNCQLDSHDVLTAFPLSKGDNTPVGRRITDEIRMIVEKYL